MAKAVIFDCFGVLATEAWLPFKKEHFGHDAALMERVTDISHQADKGLISQEDAVRQTAELAGITQAEFRQAIGGNVPDEELFDYLRELKPDYKLGFLSNISDDYLHKMFTPEHLSLFDAITLSYKSGYIKPEPEAYKNAAGQLGVTIGECVMVDDQERNITGAREAGMQAVLYKDVGQLRRELGSMLQA
jgi:HAD superfamily hydrolase (TIGR01509 family)